MISGGSPSARAASVSAASIAVVVRRSATCSGCTIDTDGAIWFADALGKQIVRVLEGGEITHQIPTPDSVYACMLGGPDGRTLFALTAAGSHPDVVAGTATGALWQRQVDVPRTPTSRP